MPTFITGLPTHVLVVHVVVVLVPLAALGAIVVALWPPARRRWGQLVVVLSAVAVASIPVATSAGEGLEHNMPRTAAIATHAHLGDELLPYAAAMLLVLVALMLLERARRRAAGNSRHAGPGTMAAPRVTPRRVRVGSVVLSGLTVVLAVITTVQVVRIGDSGARAAWGDMQYVQQAPPPGGDGDSS
jgi:hypothetical protein